MLLRQLLLALDPSLNVSQLPDVRVTAVTDDSRRVVPGSLFVARPGLTTDGQKYLADAARQGAVVAIARETPPEAPLPVLVVPDPATALSVLAHVLAGQPSRAMQVIGVTGTNGKTTVTYLIRHVLTSVGRKCGMIGTVQTDDGMHTLDSSMTTPGAVEVAELMGRMRDNGCAACAMETSSHALQQARVAGVTFAAGVFTNLSGDHLDYHGTMDAYADAKARLFTSLQASAVAVANADDPWTARILRDCRARKVTFGIRRPADYVARDIAISAAGSSFVLAGPDGCAEVRTRLLGRHNIENALAAAAACAEVFGLPVNRISRALAEAEGAPGRLQRVDCGQPFLVLVDYAHTDDALSNALTALRPICRGRLRVMFGAGGDRDRSKRPRMAAVAARLADDVVITSDNPRTENPRLIIDEILRGIPADTQASVTVESDRRAAIQLILSRAAAGDVVLLAGKGHEKYQVIGNQKIHFDDVEEARRVLAPVDATSSRG
ncbi:MAG: UDP-N-acetylmuramoyl-L-alanyl-D-glutamate--2,6-diaminopimelate ligase [Phycisphaerae bacterium]|nr:UDP-N-acetylmuramoyl-L-alanyl-D-glutamate--2,6-diaminopimelate ligase [Phycisphaerae bacterium]MDW8262193.1 UDP-N-acetylmuramoyl-L-alanyl-D-glutamate--2,6-diaminopimelate ligase [Phycisphaerales bacterium]